METLSRKNIQQKDNECDCKEKKMEETIRNKILSQKIKHKLQELKTKTITEITDQVSAMMDELVREIDTTNGNQFKLITKNTQISSENIQTIRRDKLPEKEFVSRNSMLTELFKIKHISIMYNMFASILFLMGFHTVAYDYFIKGEIKLGLNLIYYGFLKLDVAITIWIGMFASVLLTYTCFSLWADIRIQISGNHKKCKYWDHAWLTALISYYLTLLYLLEYSVLSIKMGHLTALVLLIEEIRLIMKMHAFIRSNVPKVLQFKVKSEDEEYTKSQPYAVFSKYLYFLFAPTMVYRDNYPRTNDIRWSYVGKCFGEVLLVVFLMSFTSERCFIPMFRDTCKQPTKWHDLLVSVLGSAIPASIILMGGFYCLLHAWLNGFAEMLRFGDRLFYLDWWTSTSTSRFLRTWNLIIQDWLFTYIYRDFYQYVVPRNKLVAKISVIVISAIFHEYILSGVLRFFLPVVLLQFGIVGLLASFFKDNYSTVGNIQFFVSFGIGNSIQFSFYIIELYARLNAPIENETWSDFFVPRFATCNPVPITE